MKNYMKILAVVVLAVAFSACSKEQPNQPVDDNYGEESLYMVQWTDDVQTEYTEGDLGKPYEMQWIGAPDNGKGNGMGGEKGNGGCWEPQRKMEKLDLLKFFRSIKLTKDQNEAIKGYMEAFRDCERTALSALRASEMEILDNANAQRLEIRAKLASGEIDTATAKAALKELATTTRAALRDNPLRASTLESIKLCHETLIENIRSVLNDQQRAKFDKYIERLRGFIKK